MHIDLRDFHYHLPRALIAGHPPARRGDSRLLYLPRQRVAPGDEHFSALPRLLRPGDLLVLNDTRVLPARLHGRKETGGRVEILFEHSPAPGLLQALVRRPPAIGGRIGIAHGPTLTVLHRQAECCTLGIDSRASRGYTVQRLLDEHGETPLPPYLGRAPERDDTLRYQTVYAARPGAVAAPTAGLHFSKAMLHALVQRGIRHCFVTLHVGLASFRPLRGEDVRSQRLHREAVAINADAVAAIQAARGAGGRIVAVGTTVVRALESAARNGPLASLAGHTDLFIRPGFRFRLVDLLITNFHLPCSSLLLLVSAFAGRRRVLAAYAHAVAHRYRFYSYGDAMLLERHAL